MNIQPANFLKSFLRLLPLLVFCFSSDLKAAPVSHDDEIRAYQTIPPTKSLLASPQFILVDDFNSGKLVNRRGAPWQTKAPGEGALDLSLNKDDARSQQRGYSLKANFNLLNGEKAVIQSFLQRVDVSKARNFVVKVRIDSEKEDLFSGRLRLTLTDWRHKSMVVDITALCPKNKEGWGDVEIPLSRFTNLDLDQLFSVAFEIKSVKNKIMGSLSLDEIAFFGFNDVAFESLRDNLTGFPKTVFDANRRIELNQKNDEEMLMGIARDTWKYFENARDQKTHLIVDHIRTGDASLAADYTSPTNIAMDLLATIAVMDLGIIKKSQAEQRIREVFESLKEMRRYKGFFYNFYDTKKLGITREYISSVDSGWLAISLVVVRQAFDGDLSRQASKFINAFSFQEFFDSENNQLMVGFDVPPKVDAQAQHYGLLVSEARATLYYAIGKGDIPKSAWWYLFRTAPKPWKWQTQQPKGVQRTSPDGTDYFQGYYTVKGKKIVPSWGGSLFEFLMPTLVMKERELAPQGLGLNDRTAVELQRDYALKDQKYSVWGISPAATSSGRRWAYEEFGVQAMGVKGYRNTGVVTPHVSFLALDALPEDSLKNIRNFLKLNTYGEYGLYDSYDFKLKRANPQYLSLDQGMTLIAICNYLKKGSIQERFHHDEVGKRVEDLLKESFFKP